MTHESWAMIKNEYVTKCLVAVKSSQKTHLNDLIKTKILLTVQNLTMSHLYQI